MKWLGGQMKIPQGCWHTPASWCPLVRAELDRFNLFRKTVNDSYFKGCLTRRIGPSITQNTIIQIYIPEERARNFLEFFRWSSQSFGSRSASEWNSGSGSASKSKAGSEFESALTSTFRSCGGSKGSNEGLDSHIGGLETQNRAVDRADRDLHHSEKRDIQSV